MGLDYHIIMRLDCPLSVVTIVVTEGNATENATKGPPETMEVEEEEEKDVSGKGLLYPLLSWRVKFVLVTTMGSRGLTKNTCACLQTG